MLALLWCILLQADPNAIPGVMTAKEYCDFAYRAQVAEIEHMELELADLPKQNSWDTLSPAAKAKLEKPLRDKIKFYKTSKSMPLVIERDLNNVGFGTVFQFAVTRVKDQDNGDWRVNSQLDKSMCFADFSPERRIYEWSGPETIVISGLKPSDIKQSKTGQPELRLKGLWVCCNKITIRGIKYHHIMRWPHEAEARKMWPEFLADKEKAKNP